MSTTSVTQYSGARAWALALIVWQVGLAPPALAAEGVEEIRKCVEANLPKVSAVQDLQLVSRDRSGSERIYEGTLYGKRAAGEDFNVLLRLEKPMDLRGSSYLLLRKGDDTDVFVYVPELRRVRRITTRTIAGSLFGTEFSYEDFERLQNVAEASSVERLPDSKVSERDAYVVAVVPEQGSGSAYSRIVGYVDKKTCVPLRIEFYAGDAELRKLLTLDPTSFEKHGETWVPKRVELKNIRDEATTTLIIDSVKIDEQVPDSYFTQAHLVQGR